VRLRGPAGVTPRGWWRSRAREARGAAERGRGPNVARAVPAGVVRAAGDERSHTTRTWGSSSRCLAVVTVVAQPPGRRIPGSRPRGRSAGLATRARRPSFRRGSVSRPSLARVARERPNPGSFWSRLWRGKRPREHRPYVPHPARVGSGGNGLPGGAKLRSGRDGRVNRRVTAREGSVGRAESEQLRLVRSQRPRESTLTATQSPGGLRSSSGNWSGGVWKAVAKVPSASRRRWSATNPQGSNGPRERVRLPGKGKLCRAAPRDASGMKEGCEASGRHGERRASQGSVRAANAARSVEGGKNPEDGTGEGVATLVHHGRRKPDAVQRGTRRSCVRGGKNLRRDGPGSTSGSSPRRRWGVTARQPGQT
jgi:hypothetical protein